MSKRWPMVYGIDVDRVGDLAFHWVGIEELPRKNGSSKIQDTHTWSTKRRKPLKIRIMEVLSSSNQVTRRENQRAYSHLSDYVSGWEFLLISWEWEGAFQGNYSSPKVTGFYYLQYMQASSEIPISEIRLTVRSWEPMTDSAMHTVSLENISNCGANVGGSPLKCRN